MTVEFLSLWINKLKYQLHHQYDLTSLSNSELEELISSLLEEQLVTYAVNLEEDTNEEQEDEQIRQLMFLELKAMNFREKKELRDAVFESIRGLGVLGQIIVDTDVTEVMINGYKDIFVEKAGKLYRETRTFESKEELEIIIGKFVAESGKQVNESEPIVDTRLADGSRVNVVMPPIALNGPIVTIRRFPKEAMTVQKLINYGSITEEVAEILRILVESKYNIFVAGGTGSGKTTFLNALSNFIPRDERIITVEDAAELQIKNIDNLVRLETRNAGPDGSGEISIRDLIKSALRMRPERIVVGEVRGGEALDMLQAMNTGHDGSLSTGHANSTRDMMSRLETMVLQGSNGLPLEAVRQQIASAVDIIIHLSRLRDKSRRTMEICEVCDYDFATNQINMNPLYQFVETEESTINKVVGELRRTNNAMVQTFKLQLSGISRII